MLTILSHISSLFRKWPTRLRSPFSFLPVLGGVFVVFGSFGAIPSYAETATDVGLDFDTSNLAVPSAIEVIADFRSARAWGRYQRGEYQGIEYVLYPDGSGSLWRRQNDQKESLELRCSNAGECMTIDQNGLNSPLAVGLQAADLNKVDDLGSMAEYLANSMVAGHFGPIQGPNRTVDVVNVEVISTASPEPNSGKENIQTRPNARHTLTAPSSDISNRHRPLTSRPLLKRNDLVSDRRDALVANSDKTIEETTNQSELTFAQRYKLNCSTRGSLSLRTNNRDDGQTGPGKPRVSFGCGVQINEALSFRVSMIKYLDSSDQQDWDPDFTYAVTYKASKSLSFTYSNYSARFDGPDGDFIDGLTGGNLRASYRFPPITLANGKTVRCSGSVGLPDPRQQSANLSCGFAVTQDLRIGATAYFYFPGEQGEYQPDFSYTASYRLSDQWRVGYSNYSNNRWPWNRGESPGPGISGGSLSITYTFDF